MKANEITTATAAKRAGVNVRTVRKWVASGAVKGVKVSGRIMVDVASLDARLDKAETYRYARKSRTVPVRTDLFNVVNGERINARRVSENVMADIATLVNNASESGLIDWGNGYHYAPDVDQVRKWETYTNTTTKVDPFNFDPNGELAGETDVMRRMYALDANSARELVWLIEGTHAKREGKQITKASKVVDMEKSLPNGNGESANVVKSNDATEKQCSTIRNMWPKKAVEFRGEMLATATNAVLWANYYETGKDKPNTTISKKDASAVISELFDAAWKPRETKPVKAVKQNAELEAGMYRKNGTIYKVQMAVHGSGKPYAKVFNSESMSFEYVPGAIRELTAEDRMALEEAKKYGRLYETCIVCSKTLTDEKSIQEGIGPVCAGRV